MRFLVLAFALAACVSSSSKTNNATSSKDGADCKEEKVTGSNFTREVCRTPEQREEDHKRAEDLMRNVPARPASAGN
jgi:hypothetical protein